MNIINCIEKKKHKQALTVAEIHDFVQGCVDGSLPDYQLSALLMAIWFNGMDEQETFALTMAMKNSGDVLDLSFAGQTIDKHSTGGIGDKLSLIVLPLWRAGGLRVAKMSGRGLGFTGGTIDKLEAVPGFDADLDQAQFFRLVKERGIAVTGQSASLVPADKKLYALRDVTATVDSLPLIAASVMSKKLAVGADCILLDVKYGAGSFMKTKAEAKKLAELMVKLGRGDGRSTAAILSPMDRPLGFAVGNALEIREAYAFLCGADCGRDLRENALTLAGQGFVLSGRCPDLAAGIALCQDLIRGTQAETAFLDWLQGQGGSFDSKKFLAAVDYPAKRIPLYAEKSGFVAEIDALAIGKAGMELGAGRKELGDKIDPGAGVILAKAVGDKVQKGNILATLYTNAFCAEAAQRVKEGICIAGEIKKEKDRKIEIFNGEIWK